MNISCDNNQILFLNLPLFDEVLDYHARTVNAYGISNVVACGLSSHSCEYNPAGSRIICGLCQSRAKKFAEDFDLNINFLEQSQGSVDDEINIVKSYNYALSLYRNKNILGKKRFITILLG